jgi:hypothetical protein
MAVPVLWRVGNWNYSQPNILSKAAKTENGLLLPWKQSHKTSSGECLSLQTRVGKITSEDSDLFHPLKAVTKLPSLRELPRGQYALRPR